MNSKIIILLPVHNRIEITKNFLQCLNDQTYKNWHLILIDDGCTDGTAQMVQSIVKNITVLKGNGNLWWAGSLQLAYKYLGKTNEFRDDDIVLIINDDVYIEKDYLEIAVKTLNDNENKKILLPSIAVDHLTKKTIPAGVHYDNKEFSFTPTDEIEKINCLSTRGLFLRLVDFVESGGFYPRILPHYFSDYEFTNRLIRKKKVTLFVNEKLTLKFFSETSGFERSVPEGSLVEYTSFLLSKKNKSNPISLISFILLTSAFPYCLINISNIIYLNLRQIAVVVYRSVRK